MTFIENYPGYKACLTAVGGKPVQLHAETGAVFTALADYGAWRVAFQSMGGKPAGFDADFPKSVPVDRIDVDR